MAGRTIQVERVVNGMRSERFSERLPEGTKYVVLEEDDHFHVVCGTDEELEGVGLKAAAKPRKRPEPKEPKAAPEPKAAAAPKPAAKKSTAKKK